LTIRATSNVNPASGPGRMSGSPALAPHGSAAAAIPATNSRRVHCDADPSPLTLQL
jgi:hypothetical protein